MILFWKNGNLLWQLNLNTICLHFILLNFMYFCQNCIKKIILQTQLYNFRSQSLTWTNRHWTLLRKLYLCLTYSVAIMKYCCYLIKFKKMTDKMIPSRPLHSLHVCWQLNNFCISRKVKNKEWVMFKETTNYKLLGACMAKTIGYSTIKCFSKNNLSLNIFRTKEDSTVKQIKIKKCLQRRIN